MTKATKTRTKAASARGGARAGAGRPPIFGTTLQTITIRVVPEVAAFLRSGESISRKLRQILNASEEFQNFSASRATSGENIPTELEQNSVE
jgi:hypothetical protein